MNSSVVTGDFSPECQSGVGLLEILITLVLLSIGFLTVARMQVTSLRFSQSAYYQSQASFMASDMIDRMRANIRGVQAGHYDGITTSAEASNPDCGSTSCSAADIARQDIYDWSSALYPLQAKDNFIPALPSMTDIPAVGTITRTAPGHYSVNLSWAETVNGQPTAVPMQFDFVTEF